MLYALHVSDSPYHGQASLSAYRFAEAAVARGHSIWRVFFSSNGVQNANRCATPPQDELNLVEAWGNFAKQHDIELIACVTACVRRGVLDQQAAQRYERPCANLADGFNISGLGQLAEAVIQADRLISFGH